MDKEDKSLDYAIVEEFIKFDENLYFQYSTGKKASDFYHGDIVKCTYLKGFFKIAEIFGDEISLYPIGFPNEMTKIDPTFLKKADFNQKTAKILYD